MGDEGIMTVKRRARSCRADGFGTFEYAILVAVVVAALVAMHTYVRRAMQANLKNLELELNAVTEE
jgi:hypothetical protein